MVPDGGPIMPRRNAYEPAACVSEPNGSLVKLGLSRNASRACDLHDPFRTVG